MKASDVIDFWFEELEPKDWWRKSDEFDQSIQQRFAQYHRASTLGELFEWRQTAQGLLAEVIILDQFSRNIFRDSAKAFAQDAQALTLAQFAVSQGFDKQLNPAECQFLYMPYMHSESKLIHELAVDLFQSLGPDHGYDFELKHKVIIDRFGRYPHRNAALGRESTAEETEFLKQPGSSF